MHHTHIRTDVQRALNNFTDGEIHENATHLLNVLGYQSQRTLSRTENTVTAFLEDFDRHKRMNRQKALLHEWQTADFLFQLTADEITQHTQETIVFHEDQGIDNTIYYSYLFIAIKLKGDTYSRTALASIAREINKCYAMPALLIFQHGHALTFAIINRRPSQRDGDRDVLEKVTLIKDIDIVNPHRAHLDILAEMSLDALYQRYGFTNFLELHRAWQQALDTSELNRRFFKEIADWYFWAVEKVTFPSDTGKEETIRNATRIIRLITRLIFVWFLKEKDLVPNVLFDADEIAELLTNVDADESTYYKAILQNLFFATLNQEMNTPEKPDTRKFRGDGRQHYNITSLYRYKRYFKDPDAALRLFESIPFLNGGLFECLDKPDPDNAKTILRVDGFSDRDDNLLSVPNALFFSEPQAVNLNAVYGTKNSQYTVRGLIHILNRYKFTIAENTPIEQEVALDPELLGQVFENLLAAYNPETGTTARKQTGSFYTPREVVNYMVDESVIAYLQESSRHNPLGFRSTETKLRHLLAYNDEPHQFTDTEVEHLITAIDTLKILDPACGSGAFPMGILHKLVFLLSKLDPRNAQWRQRQINRVQNTITEAEKIDDSVIRESTIEELEREIENINEAFERNALNYGRKLYLIENCIYGVDIQPIATQIAKLRFFISLIVEQRIDDTRENRGVRPLPNLETKFVAANTLLDVEKPAQMSLRNPEIDTKEQALEEVRRRHFTARTPRTKDRYRQRDAELRAETSTLLKRDGFPSETTEKIAGWDPYDQNVTADFFDPEWMFGITDGFDVVIGNPPYISHDKIAKQLKTKIKNGYQSYQPFADIYCYFIEKAIDLQNEGGILSFITSNSYLRAEYGAPIRNLLHNRNRLIRMLNIEDSQVFESAIVNVSIIVSRKPTNSSDDFCIVVNSPFSGESFEDFVSVNGFNYPQAYFDSKSWNLAEPKLVELQKKLESSGKTLEELNTKIRLGIATGSNEAFLIDEDQKQKFCEKNPINTEIIKPILRGRDISRYSYTLPKQYVLLTKNGVNVEKDYPDIYEHLDSFGDKFKNRGAQGQHWTNLRACSFYDDFKKKKIVWIELSDLGRFALCNDEVYLLNSAYFLLPPSDIDSKFLLGILNSSTIRFYLSLVAETSGMGTSRWINNYVKEFPIPAVAYEQQTGIIRIVNQILEAKIANSDADTADLEQEIDKQVYALYNLTQEDIAIVEEATQ